MEIRLDEFADGSHASVIFDRVTNRAIKIFKSYQHPSMEKSDYNEEGFNDYKRKIYQSELSAYKLISENTIRQFFPKHYTGITIERVCDNAGVDISDQFLLECALILDLIEGTSMKQNEIQVTECYKKSGINLENIFQELKKIGVNFYIDSNVFCSDSGLKIIDIATNDFVDFQIPLENNSDDPYLQLRKPKND